MRPVALGALVARSNRPIYRSPDEIPAVAQGLIGLASYTPDREDQRQLLLPLRKFARRDASFLTSALQDRTFVSPSEATHGARAALCLRALPLPTSPAALAQQQGMSSAVQSAHDALREALGAARWRPQDVHAALVALRTYSSPSSDALAHGVLHYVETVASATSARDAAAVATLTALVSCAAVLPEVRHGRRGRELLEDLAGRLAPSTEALTPAMVGSLCAELNRAQLRSGALALGLQEEADRIAQSCDARTAVEFLLFLSRQEASFLSSDSVQWLLERVMGEPLDAVAVHHLCRALRSLPPSLRETLHAELVDVISHVGSQMTELVARERANEAGTAASLATDATQGLLSAFLGLRKALRTPPSPAATSGAGAATTEHSDSNVAGLSSYFTAVNACAEFISDGLDSLENGVTSLSLSLVVALLEVPPSASTSARACGMRILRGYAEECAALPALQTFQFLLLLGDAGEVPDAQVVRYLRSCFCKTAADIPPAQLCTALRCFLACGARMDNGVTGSSPSTPAPTAADVLRAEVDAERQREEALAFRRFTLELVRRWFAEGLSMRFALALLESLYHLGCLAPEGGGAAAEHRGEVEPFLADAAAFLDTRRATATTAVHSAEAAATVCLALGEDLLDAYPDLHSFLLSVEEVGVKGESNLTPSAWMDLHDPANAIAPLTEQQQECWDLVDRMADTRADDQTTLAQLAEAYVKLIPFARPDDHKHFFAVCEHKVFKSDAILRECLTQLGTSGVVTKLSGATIASVLHSLAALRFAYPRATRRFLEGVSEEQWRDMEAAPLVQILSAMSRLGLRMPTQLAIIATRVASLSRFLAPRDIAEAVRALQALGHTDGEALHTLMTSAATRASGFDEVSLSTLFATPAVHRLLRTPEVAVPLLRRACRVVSSASARQRIAAKVRRGGVSRELLEGCATELRVLGGSDKTETLQLT